MFVYFLSDYTWYSSLRSTEELLYLYKEHKFIVQLLQVTPGVLRQKTVLLIGSGKRKGTMRRRNLICNSDIFLSQQTIWILARIQITQERDVTRIKKYDTLLDPCFGQSRRKLQRAVCTVEHTCLFSSVWSRCMLKEEICNWQNQQRGTVLMRVPCEKQPGL